jgi:hypothetical protein
MNCYIKFRVCRTVANSSTIDIRTCREDWGVFEWRAYQTNPWQFTPLCTEKLDDVAVIWTHSPFEISSVTKLDTWLCFINWRAFGRALESSPFLCCQMECSTVCGSLWTMLFLKQWENTQNSLTLFHVSLYAFHKVCNNLYIAMNWLWPTLWPRGWHLRFNFEICAVQCRSVPLISKINKKNSCYLPP